MANSSLSIILTGWLPGLVYDFPRNTVHCLRRSTRGEAALLLIGGVSCIKTACAAAAEMRKLNVVLPAQRTDGRTLC